MIQNKKFIHNKIIPKYKMNKNKKNKKLNKFKEKIKQIKKIKIHF